MASTWPARSAPTDAAPGPGGGSGSVGGWGRRAYQEPARKDRAGPTQPAVPADGLRRRLSLRGCAPMSPSGWRGGGWGPPGARGRGRPPWWPEGKPWPPAGGPPWRRMGRRFLWRVAGFIAAAFLLIAVMLTIGVVLAGTAVGLIEAPHGVRFLAIAALVVLVIVILRGGRRFQRMAVNLGEIVDAAGRIEAGEYGVQVAERGPRELQTLARAFNAMCTRLADPERNPPALFAALTPELRTPPALIRGPAEGIGDGGYPGDQAHVTPNL